MVRQGRNNNKSFASKLQKQHNDLFQEGSIMTENTTNASLFTSSQQRRNITAKRPVSSFQPRSGNTSTSTRLNAHVVLGLSLLMLSANARPLDASVQGEAESGHGLGLSATSFLSGARPEVGKSGFGSHLAESILKLLHINPSTIPQSSEPVVAGEVDTTLISDDHDSTRTSSNESPESIDANLSELVEAGSNHRTESPPLLLDNDSQNQPEPMHLFEKLLAQHPGLGFALGVADLMHKMKELFVDIAILEGEERGLRFGNTRSTDALLSQADGVPQSLGMSAGGALGLQLTADDAGTVDEKNPSSDLSQSDDPPLFEMDPMSEQEVSMPGAFNPISSDEDSTTQQQEASYTTLNPLVNPYVALSLSAVVATLFVVGLVVARHYYLSTLVNDSPDLEQATPPTDSNQGSQGDAEEKSRVSAPAQSSPSEEFNEKVSLEPSAEAPVAPQESVQQSAEQQEAKEALETLIDVANAAYQSPRLSLDERKQTTPVGTPKSMTNALDVIRMEMEKDNNRFDSLKGSLTRKMLLARSRPGTPFGVPSRPQTPVTTVTPADDSPEVTSEKIVPIPVHSRLAIAHMWDSPRSTAASSYVSATSTLANQPSLQSHLGASPTGSMVLLNSPTPSMVHLPIQRPVTASPSVAYMSAAESPSSSVVTSDYSPLTPVKTANRHSLDEPVSTFGSPNFAPTLPMPGSLLLFNDDPDDRIQLRGQQGLPMIPPAKLTETALNLALMLPATEWIFQFLVVFIGWFGFMMRPVPRATGGYRRRY